MGDSNLSPQQAAALLAASQSVLGRTQGPEQLWQDSTSWDGSAPVTIQMPGYVRLNRPLERLIVRVQADVAVSVANYTSVSPEAPQNILQSIQVQGQHATFGAQTPINLTGATAFVRSRMAQLTGSSVYTGSGSTRARVADPGIPMQAGIALTTAGSPYSLDIMYDVPVYPLIGVGQSVKRQNNAFLWMPQDWGNTLNLTLSLGDKTAFGDPTGATVEFTNCVVTVYAVYALLAQFQYRMGATGVALITERPLTTLTALATAQQIALLQKKITTGVLLKTGVLDTHQTAGVTTFASLSDEILDATQIQIDSKPIRNNVANLVYKDEEMNCFNTIMPTGYLNMSFCDTSGNILTAYRGDGLTPGNEFAVYSNVISASANNRVQYIQEQILGGPFPALG